MIHLKFPFFCQTSVYSFSMSSTSAFHERLNKAAGDNSYRQLGKITDTHPETVRRYMQGQAPSASFITNLCTALGISGQWLLSGQGPMHTKDLTTHALKSADPNELMGAVANILTMLIDRMDRMERMVHHLETRLNVSDADDGAGGSTMSHDGSNRTRSGGTHGSSAERISGAVAKRSSGDDEGDT